MHIVLKLVEISTFQVCNRGMSYNWVMLDSRTMVLIEFQFQNAYIFLGILPDGPLFYNRSEPHATPISEETVKVVGGTFCVHNFQLSQNGPMFDCKIRIYIELHF